MVICCQMVTKLSDWLQDELNKRGWLQADLARKGKITPAQVSRIMSEEQKPGLEACIGIAKALGISVDEVARRVRPGALPRTTADQAQKEKLLYQVQLLSKPALERVMDYVRYLGQSERGERYVAEARETYSAEDMPLLEQLDDDQRRMILEQVRALVEVKKRGEETL